MTRIFLLLFPILIFGQELNSKIDYRYYGEPYYPEQILSKEDSLSWPIIFDISIDIKDIKGLDENKDKFFSKLVVSSFSEYDKNFISINGDTINLVPEEFFGLYTKENSLTTTGFSNPNYYNKKEYDKIASELQRQEQAANEINKKLKLEEVKLNELREEKIRLEGTIETINETINQLSSQVKERIDVELNGLFDLAKINPNKGLGSIDDLERRLERLIAEQERLGGVNLLAEQESQELEQKVSSIKNDQSDLLAAIAKLREAIDSLNTEGRQRLLAAYGVVNENFQKLFVQLFGGGKAYLKFTDETDPLQAGLEIYASPPGKKLQNLTLLSGGEQALTALSLLFAVFLSNPAPICVLDEVDAPLDDTNVDRFCSLVEEIAKTSSTKFLVITHHRMTMARVNRLFGVTMPEQGVSQLVSVDLEKAIEIRDQDNE